MTISTNTEALNATALATRAIHAGQEPDPTTGASYLYDVHVQAGWCRRPAQRL
jgi:spore germination cell wall hydrolase CwlJ-like protein